MFLQCTADLPNYFELHKNSLESFEDEKCGLVNSVSLSPEIQNSESIRLFGERLKKFLLS